MTQPPTAVLALDVGGTTVKGAAFDRDGTALTPEVRRPSVEGPAILDVMAEVAETVLAALAGDGRRAGAVGAVGVAMLGLVDPVRGVCVRSVNLDLADLDVASPLRQRLGLDVVVDNDVAAAGAAIRAGSDAVDPFVVVIGTGVAGVTFVGGHPVRGVSGPAGEFGHIVVRPGGRLCRCGAHGCVEAVSGAAGIVEAYAEATGTRLPGAEAVLDRAGSDPAAAAVWDEAVTALADGLNMVCALLAPGAIVIGGGLSAAGEALLEPLRTAMEARRTVNAVPPMWASDLGGRAGLIGAGALAWDLIGPAR